MANVNIREVSGGEVTALKSNHSFELDDGTNSHYVEWDSIVAALSPEGLLVNGVITPTVSSNNLTVAIKTLAGSDPSSTDPVFVKINGTVRTIAAACSITLNAGTNWFNSGGVELGTLVLPYFVYLVWDSNSSAVALTIARKSHYRIVATTMSTTTSENHIYGYSGFTAGDDMVNIGYFEATLSLTGTGHLWTVPTFTSLNLKNVPTLESEWKTWTPVWTAVGTGTPTYGTVTVAFAKYKVVPNGIQFVLRATGTTGGSTVTVIYATLPFQSKTSADASGASVAVGYGSVGGVIGGTGISAGTPDKMSMFRYDLGDMGIGAGRVVNISGFMEM